MKLKGTTTIELTNVNTGEKETYTKENLVTNALSDLFSKMGRMYGSNLPLLTPIYNNALGGLILFDTTLTENANNYTLPSNATAGITGYSSDDVNTSADLKRGSFNADESGTITDGYRYVFDFATNQANGDIGSISLCSKYTGKNPYSYLFAYGYNSQRFNNATLEVYNYFGYICDVEETDEGYIFTAIKKATTTEVSITKWLYRDLKVNLEGTLLGFEKISEVTLNVNDSTSYHYWVNGGDGYYYGIFSTGSNTTIMLAKIRISDNAYTNSVSVSLPNIISTIRANSNSDYLGGAIIVNGFLYLSSFAGIEKISLADTTQVTSIPNSVFTSNIRTNVSKRFFMNINNDVFTEMGVVFEDGTGAENVLNVTAQAESQQRIAFTPTTMTGTEYSSGGRMLRSGNVCFLIAAGQYRMYEAFLENYLATINNLDTTLTKTADKTMKITYTLTYATT